MVSYVKLKTNHHVRLFSCGTNKDGDSCIVEWNESEGVLLRTYVGLRKCSSDIVQFGTSKNTILAAGNDQLIKFWNVDNVNLLATVDADGGLPVCAHTSVAFIIFQSFLHVFLLYFYLRFNQTFWQ